MSGPLTDSFTFLFTDIERSSEYWANDPDGMAVCVRAHDDLVKGIIGANGGQVFKTVGDSVHAVFASPAAAVRAAIAVQIGITQHAASWPHPLRVRAGMHIGAAEHRENDYFGLSLARTARVRDAGHGGQVLATEELVAAVGDSMPPGVTATDLGSHLLHEAERAERVFAILHPDFAQRFPPLRALRPLPSHLPPSTTQLIGRDADLQAVVRSVRAHRCVTLVGTGGIGKTTLATQAARDVEALFPGGVHLVELDKLTPGASVIASVARLVGAAEGGGGDLVDAIGQALDERRALLVLDNAEHMLEPVAEAVRQLLGRVPPAQVLVTSRIALGLPEESVTSVRPLGMPDSINPSASELTSAAAVQLFVERARRARPDFRITEENTQQVADVLNQLDGIPLAIELAAAQLAMMTLPQLHSRLSQDVGVLRSSAGGRHGDLAELIAWTADRLDADTRRLLTRLSVFHGGCTIEAAAAVCRGPKDRESAVMTRLAQLVEKSLAVAEPVGYGMRYRLLETVRSWARLELAESGERPAVERRHAEYFTRLAEEIAPHLRGPDPLPWRERLIPEVPNILAVLRSPVRARLRLRLSASLPRFWTSRTSIVAGRAFVTEALQRDADAPPAVKAAAHFAIGYLSYRLADMHSASDHAAAAVGTLRESGARDPLAEALGLLGTAHRFNSQGGIARACYAEAAEIKREVGDEIGLAACTNNLAIVMRDSGDFAGSLPFYEESLAIYQRRGDLRNTAILLNNLADACFGAARYSEAATYLRTADDYAARAGAPELVVPIWTLESAVALYENRLDDALPRIVAAIRAAADRDDPTVLVQPIVIAAQLCARRGALGTAVALYKRAEMTDPGTALEEPDYPVEKALQEIRRSTANLDDGGRRAAELRGRLYPLDELVREVEDVCAVAPGA